ncbi:AKAP7 2'5' RNA ligase-like domain-containing protein [Plectosphaerella plurivora]|uniref:AKAP7 2'5' RNA ligase-like domain-containing protein n=1 Tax=Plectosphaerella plurivora TaxID=936078 RepID=A0A9P8VEG2_9PEZI|nr:AKAP7 2'5' RNA ligase-like domain-containing protein [Plectosphaerella plurivora]
MATRQPLSQTSRTDSTPGMAPRPPAFTHFLCLKLVTPTSRPQLASSLAAFKADVISSFGIPADAVRPLGTLHLTLGMMSLAGNEELNRAGELLRSLKPRELLSRVRAAGVAVAAAPTNLQLTLRGIHSMQPSADKATVLYAPPDDPAGVLRSFCEALRGEFLEAGLMFRDERPLLLHATISSGPQRGGARGRGGRGGSRGGGRLTIDARDILGRYEDYRWMEGVPLEKIAICRMGAKATSRMPVSEKRRSAALASAGGIFTGTSNQTSASSGSSAHRSNAAAQRTSSPGPDADSSLIAPPPRAQLGDEAAGMAPKDREHNTPSPAPGSSPTTAALLRDKDQRIADLERELGYSTTEFARLLDSLSQKESDSAGYWQAKHEHAEQRVHILETEAEHRDEQNAELASVADALADRLSEREREAVELRAQVRGLKEFVSTSTRSDGQTATSDEVFGDGMARLGNALQNWVIVNFRKAKFDIQKADDATRQELERLVPMYQDLAKVHLLQTLVSRILVDMVFNAYFVGLSPEQTQLFGQMEATLSSLGSDESVNQWRSTTLTLLRREVEPNWQAETEEVVAAVTNRINRTLGAVTDAQGSEARDNALRVQVLAAIDLARLLRVQRAVFAVYMPEVLPHQQTFFDPATMEDVGGEEDEDALAHREICCVTFPGIVKHGDESGGSLHYRNVIAKARVLCSPE